MSYIEASDTSLRKTGQIKLHGASGFAGMRKAGALVAKCLDELTDIVKAGVPTSRIDEFVRDFAFSHGAYPATLMYRGYRYSTCTSINHVVCHGMPGDRALKEGDIVNIDVTFIVDGWYGDSSRMYVIGPIARKAERLIEITYEAMMRGIAAVKPGATTGDIGHAIQSFVEPQGMSVVRDFCGHGLGRIFHDEPNIIHIGRPGEGVMLKPGMFFTIEPMINLGKPHVKILADGWTAVTRDRSLSAQGACSSAQGVDDGDGRTGLASTTYRGLSHRVCGFLRKTRPRGREHPVRQQADHTAGRVHVRHRRPRRRRLR
jgi:methionyl aminopeptidase